MQERHRSSPKVCAICTLKVRFTVESAAPAASEDSDENQDAEEPVEE